MTRLSGFEREDAVMLAEMTGEWLLHTQTEHAVQCAAAGCSMCARMVRVYRTAIRLQRRRGYRTLLAARAP